tara:strand:+ start:4102 stop:4563 length:462 start_codon:yes stop_codon:yes gene_type:complete
MIIECKNCKKKFDLDSNLIPKKGRLIQCGSCNYTWFFTPHENKSISDDEKQTIQKTTKDIPIQKIEKKNIDNLKNKIKEKTKFKEKDKNSSSISYIRLIFSFLIVFVVSLTALIILIDTFKVPLGSLIPDIELYLFSLYEVFMDIKLFVKDLI